MDVISGDVVDVGYDLRIVFDSMAQSASANCNCSADWVSMCVYTIGNSLCSLIAQHSRILGTLNQFRAINSTN